MSDERHVEEVLQRNITCNADEYFSCNNSNVLDKCIVYTKKTEESHMATFLLARLLTHRAASVLPEPDFVR